MGKGQSRTTWALSSTQDPSGPPHSLLKSFLRWEMGHPAAKGGSQMSPRRMPDPEGEVLIWGWCGSGGTDLKSTCLISEWILGFTFCSPFVYFLWDCGARLHMGSRECMSNSPVNQGANQPSSTQGRKGRMSKA